MKEVKARDNDGTPMLVVVLNQLYWMATIIFFG